VPGPDGFIELAGRFGTERIFVNADQVPIPLVQSNQLVLDLGRQLFAGDRVGGDPTGLRVDTLPACGKHGVVVAEGRKQLPGVFLVDRPDVVRLAILRLNGARIDCLGGRLRETRLKIPPQPLYRRVPRRKRPAHGR
jgi:hypothetical protein